MDDPAHLQVTAVHLPDGINPNENTLVLIIQQLNSHYAMLQIKQCVRDVYKLPTVKVWDQGSICEFSGARVGRRLRRQMMTPTALLEEIYSQGSDFSNRG